LGHVSAIAMSALSVMPLQLSRIIHVTLAGLTSSSLIILTTSSSLNLFRLLPNAVKKSKNVPSSSVIIFLLISGVITLNSFPIGCRTSVVLQRVVFYVMCSIVFFLWYRRTYTRVHTGSTSSLKFQIFVSCINQRSI
jgi:hypothetical protein